MTVCLRNFWPGAKPIAVVTTAKSHAGRVTLIEKATADLAEAIRLNPEDAEGTTLRRQLAPNPGLRQTNTAAKTEDQTNG